MVERIRNAIKNDRKRSSSSISASVKRSKSADDKKNDVILRRYPSGVKESEDSSSTDSHVSACYYW